MRSGDNPMPNPRLVLRVAALVLACSVMFQKARALEPLLRLSLYPPKGSQATWFTFLCCFAFACIFAMLFILRMRHAHATLEKRLRSEFEERERISRELHDSLLQGFQGLMLNFQSVLKAIPVDQPSHAMLEKALDRADEVLAEGKQSIRRTTEDLATQVSRFGNELSENYQISFSLDQVGAAQPLDPSVAAEAFRIAREVLFNAFQHSRASRIEAEVTYGSSEMRLCVRDNGIGMSAELAKQGQHGHWGVIGIRERAKRIRSRLEIWSVAGAGTEVALTIPSEIAYQSSISVSAWRRIWERLIKRGGHARVN